MAESLKDKTVKGVAWSGIDNVASLGIQFLIGVILARLLSPSEYGIIGLITVFLAISEAFITAGFGSALIRKTDRTEDDLSTVLIFSVVTSIVFYFFIISFSAFNCRFFRISAIRMPKSILLCRIR